MGVATCVLAETVAVTGQLEHLGSAGRCRHFPHLRCHFDSGAVCAASQLAGQDIDAGGRSPCDKVRGLLQTPVTLVHTMEGMLTWLGE
jgi:hypothetical protein